MASVKQLTANRANARRSTGPKTSAGKRKSSLNALKYGLCSRDVVMSDEDPLEFERFRAALEEVFPPDNVLVRELVDHLAGLFWRLRRGPKLEAAARDDRLEDKFSYLFHLADPDTRKKVLERLRQLQQARSQEEGGEIGFVADLGQALCREMPEVLADVLEAEKARETDRSLAANDRHENSLRNGVARTLAMLHAIGAARSAED